MHKSTFSSVWRLNFNLVFECILTDSILQCLRYIPARVIIFVWTNKKDAWEEILCEVQNNFRQCFYCHALIRVMVHSVAPPFSRSAADERFHRRPRLDQRRQTQTSSTYNSLTTYWIQLNRTELDKSYADRPTNTQHECTVCSWATIKQLTAKRVTSYSVISRDDVASL